MSGSLVEVDGSDVAGTTEYVFYDNGGIYTLLGSASNISAAVTASTGVTLASYSSIVFLPLGEPASNSAVFNQAETIQANYTTELIDPVGATGATGPAGATGATGAGATGAAGG